MTAIQETILSSRQWMRKQRNGMLVQHTRKGMVTPNRVSLRFANGSGSSAGGAFCIINTRSSFHDESMSCDLLWGTVQGR
jgi:hypothetical protein